MADGQIRISPSDLKKLEALSEQINATESFVNAERVNRATTDIRSAVDTIVRNKEELERFFKFKVDEEEEEFFTRASQAITGASAGFGQGLEFGSQIGSPQVGAIAAVVLSIVGATLGATIETARRDADRRLQALEDAQFGFNQALKRNLDGIKEQDKTLREFQRRESADRRAKHG